MDRRKHQIERLLRKNYSKLGVRGKLSDMNLRYHWLDSRNKEDEILLTREIDELFNSILEEGNHTVGRNKGKNKSEFLQSLPY